MRSHYSPLDPNNDSALRSRLYLLSGDEWNYNYQRDAIKDRGLYRNVNEENGYSYTLDCLIRAL